MLVAHRGFRSPKGENCMRDFKNALKTCKAVEFDIRLTKDKRIIIFHDHNFKRIANVDKTVRHFTYDEIKQIPFFKTNPDWLPPLFIEDFVEKIAKEYEMINVEIKPDRYTKSERQILLDALNKLRESTKAEIIVSSFGLNDLKFIATLDRNKFKRGYLVEGLSKINYDLIKEFDYLHPYVGTLKLKSSYPIINKINLPLNIWTFKKDEDVVILKKIYRPELLHAFISDNPNLKI
ncbi:glycerophosphodiester phosphodiesterase [Spiroplasma endosymbiont of Crioceris asparagi]|uniref:glycerophosphodiester phosphodiesterase n=1 Tax=Spiroplasma endosymbiont of Crioceris asparagi TaxID=3066286 RepID=UPI0030D1B146